MVDIKTLVGCLGGSGAVARKFNITTAAVSQWIAADAVPPAREAQMWVIANYAGVDWTPPGAEGFRLAEKDAA
jgi:DNA-binding transcriptional regulator YdaS (Cro superfamily)